MLERLPQVIYLSYDGATEPLGRSQVVAYLERLSTDFEVTLISFEKDGGEDDPATRDEMAASGIRWRPVPYHGRPPVASTAFDVARGARLLDAELRGRSGAILHTRSYVATQMVLSSRAARRAKLLFDIRGFWADERVEGGIWKEGPLFRLAKRQETAFFRRADAVVTLTTASVETVRRWSGRADVPIEVIPTCVEWQRFADAPERPGGPHVVWNGSVGTWYRFELGVRFAQLAGLPLSVLTRQADAARSIVGPGASVESVPHAELPSRLFAGDVGLCLYRDSFSRLACAPTRFGEYMAAGMPSAVTAGLGDLPRIVEEHDVGLVIDRDDDDALVAAARRLTQMAADPATRARCREVARRFFDVDEGARRYADLYRRLGAAG